MPNWVKSIAIFGTKKVLEDCIVDKENGHKSFDLDKVIPMPKEYEKENPFEGMTMEEELLFKKANDGCKDWYEWRVKHWGTKWNTDETVVLDDNMVTFNTAWNMPDEVFREISKKYHTTVKVVYADESMTENSGYIVYDNGHVTVNEMGDVDSESEKFRDSVWDESVIYESDVWDME